MLAALQAAVPAAALHTTRRAAADNTVQKVLRCAADLGVPVVETGAAELDRIAGHPAHHGVVLRLRPHRYAEPADLLAAAAPAADHPPGAQRRDALPLVVALDGVTGAGDLGAIARSVDTFGGSGIVVPARRGAGVTVAAWTSSAGALTRVPVARAPNLAGALASYRDAGLFVAGVDPTGEIPVADLPVADAALVLVIGSPPGGLSRVTRQRCDVVVHIPAAAGRAVLDAGAATAVALYEVARRRAECTP